MQVLMEGHRYVLANFENAEAGQTIQFIEKVRDPEVSDTLRTVNDGTTNEEVLKMLINRMQYLQAKAPCRWRKSFNSVKMSRTQTFSFRAGRVAHVARKADGRPQDARSRRDGREVGALWGISFFIYARTRSFRSSKEPCHAWKKTSRPRSSSNRNRKVSANL